MKKQDTKTKTMTPPQPMDLIQETYVDGTASISIRQSVAKIDFYQASLITTEDSSDEQKESRKISHRITLPMSGLTEIYGILGNIINEVQQNTKK